jgi:tetratricopeptide (TPR) repeat protein
MPRWWKRLAMNDDERKHLQELLEASRKRLRVREQQAEQYGISVPPEVKIELDDLRTEVAGLEARLSAAAALLLPEPVPDFVGREEELKQLVKALGGRPKARAAAGTGAAAAISGVRGLGGLGKTQLALSAARRLAAIFPDGQIMLALRGASADPMTPELALQTVIRSYDRAGRLPDDLAQLQAIYHSILSGKRVLILADDARDAAQVRPLLPPPGCALLITTRQRFALPGMAALDLEALPRDKAEKLLRQVCPRVGAHTAKLAQLCGYLPLALRISASVLASDDTLSVPRYLERLERERLALLRDPDDPAADVEASLRLSYDALEATAQSVLCQCSVFVAGFDLAAAEAVVALTPNPSPTAAGEGSSSSSTPSASATEAALPSPVATGEGPGVRDLLGLLRRRSLVEWDAERERYRLHELVRAFGAAQVEDAEALGMRYADYYANIARKADTLYYQGGDALITGLALFDAERAHIDTVWEWIGRGGTLVKDKLLYDYAYATTDIGLLRYDMRKEQIPHFEAALEAARRASNRGAEMAWLGNLGIAYSNLGEVRRAIEFYEQTLMITREIGNRHGEGNALGNLGLAYADLGETRRAIEYNEHCIAHVRKHVTLP